MALSGADSCTTTTDVATMSGAASAAATKLRPSSIDSLVSPLSSNSILWISGGVATFALIAVSVEERSEASTSSVYTAPVNSRLYAVVNALNTVLPTVMSNTTVTVPPVRNLPSDRRRRSVVHVTVEWEHAVVQSAVAGSHSVLNSDGVAPTAAWSSTLICSDNLTSILTITASVGACVGVSVGDGVGTRVGYADVGVPVVGFRVGNEVGARVGFAVGIFVGAADGPAVDGDGDGAPVGAVGAGVGAVDGDAVGSSVNGIVGLRVGKLVGATVGVAVGEFDMPIETLAFIPFGQ